MMSKNSAIDVALPLYTTGRSQEPGVAGVRSQESGVRSQESGVQEFRSSGVAEWEGRFPVFGFLICSWLQSIRDKYLNS
jgi:hypothetical protein